MLWLGDIYHVHVSPNEPDDPKWLPGSFALENSRQNGNLKKVVNYKCYIHLNRIREPNITLAHMQHELNALLKQGSSAETIGAFVLIRETLRGLPGQRLPPCLIPYYEQAWRIDALKEKIEEMVTCGVLQKDGDNVWSAAVTNLSEKRRAAVMARYTR
jgi:hypothetical protein